MSVRLDSSNYDTLPVQTPQYIKFQTQRYTIVGSADYVVASAIATAWQYDLIVSASASALGGGVSAGGLDSLENSFAKTTALTFVTDRAVTATGWFMTLQTVEQINPTWFKMKISLVKAT